MNGALEMSPHGKVSLSSKVHGKHMAPALVDNNHERKLENNEIHC